MIKTISILILLFSFSNLYSQSKLVSKFDTITMTFKGSKLEQASYLLKPVNKYGILGKPLNKIPSFLNSILSNKIKIIKIERLRRFLLARSVRNNEIGGVIDSSLSKSENDITANYFVIHDASNLIAGIDSFPSIVNTIEWTYNNLTKYSKFANAHLFINRLGKTLTSNDFNKRIQGTKFESKTKNAIIKGKSVGNFIHIEMIQPRISDRNKKNDAIAIKPGFTDEQYKKLALIYIIASTRKNDWLVPAYHATLDEGFKDGHDDPQNFDLEKFDNELMNLYKIIN
jgi:hypothetical protein